jgi:nicotinic acid phosphoribosyltransferase
MREIFRRVNSIDFSKEKIAYYQSETFQNEMFFKFMKQANLRKMLYFQDRHLILRSRQCFPSRQYTLP